MVGRKCDGKAHWCNVHSVKKLPTNTKPIEHYTPTFVLISPTIIFQQCSKDELEKLSTNKNDTYYSKILQCVNYFGKIYHHLDASKINYTIYLQDTYNVLQEYIKYIVQTGNINNISRYHNFIHRFIVNYSLYVH